MATFHMMVGLVGSGKSTVAKNIAALNNAMIVEADEIRAEMFGDAAVQGDNNVIFGEMQKRAEAYLAKGIDVVYDATNINYKMRMGTVQRMRKFATRQVCWVVMTPVEVCKERNANRERVVPEYIIDRMWKSFTMPQYFEGWDAIELVFDYDAADYMLTPYLNAIKDFQQDNPHHSGTLGEHTRKVMDGVGENVFGQYANFMKHVALLHDNGKLHTKGFKDAKGNDSTIAHFYGHENCGAYEAAFYLDASGFMKDEVIHGCGLIQLHMRPYSIEGNQNAHLKLLKLIGAQMYNDLILLNYADRNGK